MNENIINELFAKFYCETEKSEIREESYLKAKKKAYVLEKKLLNSLDENQAEQLKAYADAMTDIAFFECRQSFSAGVKTGADFVCFLLDF